MAKSHFKQITAEHALIYCRVSSEKQVRYGNSIESQKTESLNKAESLGVLVEGIFEDKAISGAANNRDGWNKLAEHILSNPDKNYYIIAEDVSRIARGNVFRKLIAKLPIQRVAIKTVKQEFDNTPEGEFMLDIFLAVGGYERRNNKRRVIYKQDARLLSGYWVFNTPLGYMHPSKLGIKDKVIRKDKPFDKIIEEAFTGYAHGRFDSMADVTRFMNLQPEIQNRYKSGKIHKDSVGNIFRNILYTGHILLPEGLWKTF